MSASEGDKWRAWIMDIIKIVLPAVLAWQGTAYIKDKEIAHKQGALDTANGVVYTGQSPEYYEGFHEQIAKEAEAQEEEASDGEIPILDPDNSETVATGMAALMLGGPMASDQVGQVLTTITGAIGLNPEIAGGVSALYALFRLWKKWRVGRKAAKAAAVVLAVVLAGASSTVLAGEPGRAVLVGAGVVDAEGADDEGSAYSASWLEPLGKSGRWSGNSRLQRLTDLDSLDAYIVDLDMLANFGMGKRFQGFLGGGLGSVFEDDVTQTTATVTQVPAGLHGTTPGAPAPATTLTVHLEDEDTYLRWSMVGGVRVWLDAERRFGVIFEYRRSDALQDAGHDRAQDGFGLSFAVPTP